MKIKDVMTRDIINLNLEDSIEKAAQMMKEYDVGSIPICDGNKVIGIITDRDITLRSVAEGKINDSVRNVMSSNPVFVSPDTDVHDALRIMSERQIRRLPVIENGNIEGMVSIGDLAVEPKFKDNAGKALSNISEPCTPNI